MRRRDHGKLATMTGWIILAELLVFVLLAILL